jgi:lipoate-protein ligase B
MPPEAACHDDRANAPGPNGDSAVTERASLRRQPGGGYLYDLPGLTPYAEALELQLELAAARTQGAVPDTLIVCEHEPVVTLGSSTDAAAEVPDRAALDARGIAVVEVGRGGRATYHGPGQLVAYPIVDLTDLGRDIRGYVERLERAVVATLASLGVESQARAADGLVGVFAGERKIASIGIEVRSWVARHGVALNVSCDLEPFSLFVPCGLHGVEVTSVERELGRPVGRAEVEPLLVGALAAELERDFAALPGVEALA